VKSEIGANEASANQNQPLIAPTGNEVMAWIELGPGGSRILRTLSAPSQDKPDTQDTHGCPTARINKKAVKLQLRPAMNPKFPGLVCETTLPATASTVTVGQSKFKFSRNWNPRRILIYGDTGCRIKIGKSFAAIQTCNDPKEWPLQQISEAAAKWKPDLIIHVGDFHYRESPCPPNDQRCAGAISGDVWDSWMQDFFLPTKPLLAKAPWIFIRGNHEDCARAGTGWFQFLDPRPVPQACTDSTEPFLISVGDHIFASIDVADQKRMQPGLDAAADQLTNQIEKQNTKAQANTDHRKTFNWILIHRPVFTLDPAEPQVSIPHLNGVLAEAGQVAAIFSGHRHQFRLLEPKASHPPEFLTGNGGANLDQPSESNNAPETGSKQSSLASSVNFGFMTLERKAERAWTVQEHDQTGRVTHRCLLTVAKESTVRCLPTH
jgi:hypothetical protein